MVLELFGLGEPYKDPIDLEQRVAQLPAYFYDFAEATEGRISLEQLIHSQSLLDVGMGRGALGHFLRQQGMKGRIVGVDADQYEDAAYKAYTRTLFGNIEDVFARGELKNEQFAHIFCMAPSPALGQWVIDNRKQLPVANGGNIFVATELPLVHGGDARVFHGVSLLKNYYVMQK